MTIKGYHRCSECLCTDVQIIAWIRPNENDGAGEILHDEMYNEDTWCPQCEANRTVEFVEGETIVPKPYQKART